MKKAIKIDLRTIHIENLLNKFVYKKIIDTNFFVIRYFYKINISKKILYSYCILSGNPNTLYYDENFLHEFVNEYEMF